MREPRNPFRLRASESIESDATFLRLFGPGMLDLLPVENLWDKPQLFRSAPGGGKTSLLRLFTPSALLTLHSRRTEENVRELHQRMMELGAVGEGGPRLLGVLLLCGRNYALLQDLDLDQPRKNRLFFGLLNARIVLAPLRSTLALRGLAFPGDLPRLRVTTVPDLPLLPDLKLPCDGAELFRW